MDFRRRHYGRADSPFKSHSHGASSEYVRPRSTVDDMLINGRLQASLLGDKRRLLQTMQTQFAYMTRTNDLNHECGYVISQLSCLQGSQNAGLITSALSKH